MTLLSVRNLHAEFGAKPVLKGVSLDIAPGELVGLIGPNGAGKSTLLRSALGLMSSRGEILLAGRDSRRLSATDRALAVSYLPQEREVAWSMTVEQLIWLGRAPHRAAFQAPSTKDKVAVEAAIDAMEINGFRHRAANALSGGEKARVLVARALAQDAPLLLADEPTAGLDPSHQISLMRTFLKIVRNGGSVVVSLHDLGLAARWCTRLVMLVDGQIIADGSPSSVLEPERLRKVYQVETFCAEYAGGLIVQPYDLVSDG